MHPYDCFQDLRRTRLQWHSIKPCGYSDTSAYRPRVTNTIIPLSSLFQPWRRQTRPQPSPLRRCGQRGGLGLVPRAAAEEALHRPHRLQASSGRPTLGLETTVSSFSFRSCNYPTIPGRLGVNLIDKNFTRVFADLRCQIDKNLCLKHVRKCTVSRVERLKWLHVTFIHSLLQGGFRRREHLRDFAVKARRRRRVLLRFWCQCNHRAHEQGLLMNFMIQWCLKLRVIVIQIVIWWIPYHNTIFTYRWSSSRTRMWPPCRTASSPSIGPLPTETRTGMCNVEQKISEFR